MKKYLSLIAIITSLILTSCSNDDNVESLTGKNMVTINFDNGFNGNDLSLNTYNVDKTVSGEQLKIDEFKYILSNFVLISEDGKETPYEDGYFIIDEKAKVNDIMLKNIPAGKYSKIRFGIGIDQNRYLEGQNAQQDFWTEAKEHGMTWSWQAGYKFVVLEGFYISDKNEEEFKIHNASRGSSVDLYKEVTLNLTNEAIVSNNQSPLIHVMVDAMKIINGTNKIKLAEGSVIMGGDKASLIAVNNTEMFKVHHVHNGDGNHHN